MPKSSTAQPIQSDHTDLDRPQTPDELHDWIAQHLEVSIARTAIISGHAAPFDYLTHTFFEGRLSPQLPADCIVWANRGGGKTLLGAIATLLDLVFKPEIQVRLLAGSVEQGARMHHHLRAFFARHEFKSQLKGRITDRRITLKNGSTVELLAPSQASVRGTRPQKLRCDEVELFDDDVWSAAQLTTRSRTCGQFHVRGSIECLSTMHHPHGLMSHLIAEAALGKRTVFKWGVIDTLEVCGDSFKCGASCSPSLREGVGGRAHSEAEPNENPIAPSPTPHVSIRAGSAAPGRCPDAHPEANPSEIPNSHSLPQLSLRAGSAAPGRCASANPEAHPSPTPCPLFPECRGRAKDKSRTGHITISDALRMKSRVSLPVWDSEMLCNRPTRTHTVFPEFDPKVHVYSPSLREGAGGRAHSGAEPHDNGNSCSPCAADSLPLAGMDFGYRSPTVFLWAHLDSSNRLFITDERHVPGQTLDAHIRAILDSGYPLPAWVGADPAGSSRNEHTGISSHYALRRAGLQVRSRGSTIIEGLSLISARLKPADGSPPRLFIHERCENLIRALEEYHYDPKRPFSDDPVKDGPDHAIDALRYLIINLDRPHVTEVDQYAL